MGPLDTGIRVFGNAQWLYVESSRRVSTPFRDSDFHGVPQAGIQGHREICHPRGMRPRDGYFFTVSMLTDVYL